MKRFRKENIKPDSVENEQQEESNELDDISLETVAGGTNWHPRKEDRDVPPRWGSPNEW